MATLEQVKAALGITGTYHDATLQVYFDEVVEYIRGAGVPAEKITAGAISRGVSDLWNYGAEGGKLSEYFKNRVTQLALRR